MATVESTPPRSVRRRTLFHADTHSSTKKLKTPTSSSGKWSSGTPSKNSDVSAYSSPDRYSSPPHSPRWILDTPPKVTGSLLTSPSKFLDDNMPCRMSRFDNFLNSLSLKETSNLDKNELVKLKASSDETKENAKQSPIRKSKANERSFPCNSSAVLRELQVPVKRKRIEEKVSLDNEVKLPLTKNSVTDLFIQPSAFYKTTKGVLDDKEDNQNTAANNKFAFFGGVKRNRSSSVESTRRNRSASYTKQNVKKTKLSKRMRLGEINIGVKHGIRKPKPKKKVKAIKTFSMIPKILPSDRIKFFSEPPLIQGTSQDTSNTNTSNFGIPRDMQTTPKKKIPSPKKIPTPPPDPSKKFFKTNRTLHITKKATVTMENNVKVEVRHGKYHLPKKPLQKPSVNFRSNSLAQKRLEIVFEPLDIDDTPQNMLQDKVSDTVKTILGNLESESPKDDDNVDDRGIQNKTPLCTTTIADNTLLEDFSTCGSGNICNTTVQAANVISGIPLEESLLTPVSCCKPSNVNASDIPKDLQECSTDDVEVMTGSPLRTQNLNKDEKLYPIFYQDQAQKNNSVALSLKKNTGNRKRKWQITGDDQYQIDAGQKKFGATQCKECGIVYQLGDWEDEMAHENYHNNSSALKFCGWKDERVVCVYGTGRVIVVYPDDSKMWMKKVKSVLEVANRETGYVDVTYNHKYLEHSKAYMYVNSKSVLGVLVAEPKKEAHKMLSIEGVDCCSAETYPVWCGISHIWTAPNYRRKKVASRLLDCMRMTFSFDHFLEKDEFAFSVPTLSGKALAEKYTGTPNFLVYS